LLTILLTVTVKGTAALTTKIHITYTIHRIRQALIYKHDNNDDLFVFPKM